MNNVQENEADDTDLSSFFGREGGNPCSSKSNLIRWGHTVCKQDQEERITLTSLSLLFVPKLNYSRSLSVSSFSPSPLPAGECSP